MINVALLIRLREKRGLSQGDLAQAVGVSQQLIGEIEAGRVRSTRSIYRIADIFDISPHELDPDIRAPSRLEQHFQNVTKLLKKLPEDEADFHIRKFEEMLQFLVKGKTVD